MLLVTILTLHLLSAPHHPSAARVKSGHSRQERVFRPLVPQLLPNYTTPSLPPASEVTCNYASLACTYRAGCGSALKQYMAMCQDLVQGVTTKCSMGCRHALIALISTNEGERLMQVNTLSFSLLNLQIYWSEQNACTCASKVATILGIHPLLNITFSKKGFQYDF